MTNNDNSNKVETAKKPLGLSSGKLGLSSNNIRTVPAKNFVKPQTTHHSGASVIVITKTKGGTNQSESHSNLSQEARERGLQLLKMAAEAKNQSHAAESQSCTIEKKEPPTAEEDTASYNAAVVTDAHYKISTTVDSSSTGEHTNDVKSSSGANNANIIQEKILRGHYIKGLSSNRGKVRDLNQIFTSNSDKATLNTAKDSLDTHLHSNQIAGAAEVESQSKKGLTSLHKKREKDHVVEESTPGINKKSALSISPELKRLSRQTNKGSLSRFAISVSESDVDEVPYVKRSGSSIRKSKNKKNKHAVQPQEKVFREVLIPDFITVQELANRMTEKAVNLIKSLMGLGVMVTVNQTIDADTAEIIVLEFGHKPKRVTDAEFEKSMLQQEEGLVEHQECRAPIVTIMGHVDHGKTSLLDALRLTDVVAQEAGGITQHIGAYSVALAHGKHITFLDTPGHEAFTAMRMRGAKVTDIVILVVAADDGIKEQTIEAINHAKAAGVNIIVAINKVDKPGANPERVKNELLHHNLVPEEMGGDTIIVSVSAKTKQGLDKLEEAILLQAEIMSLKANPRAPAQGAVIEARMDKARGVVATLLIQRGTLKTGDIVVVGSSYGKVKALLDDKGHSIKSAGPSLPVEILGLNRTPTAGDVFSVIASESLAKELIDFRMHKEKEKKSFVMRNKDSLDRLFTKARQEGGHKSLSIIIKADVNGSAEAIANSLMKIVHEEVTLNVLHSAVGGITESDVTLAAASNALIIGFNVRANNQARAMAKQLEVDIKYYSIIYNLIDDVKAAVSGLLSPLVKEKLLGYVEIRHVFDLSKCGKVAGCTVTEGVVQRHASARLLRDNIVVHEGKLKTLKRFKEDVKEVKAGFECGISFEKYDDIKIGDKLEIFSLVEEVRQI